MSPDAIAGVIMTSAIAILSAFASALTVVASIRQDIKWIRRAVDAETQRVLELERQTHQINARLIALESQSRNASATDT